MVQRYKYNMARLFTSGFELNSATNDVEWDSQTSGASVVSTNIRSGTYAGRLLDSAGAGERWEKRIVSSNQNGAFYIRFYLYITAIGTSYTNSRNRIWHFGSDSGLPTVQIYLNSDGSLGLWDSTVQIGSNSSVLSTGQYYRVEVYAKNNTVSGKLEATARINGVDFATTTTSANTGTFQYMRFGEMSGTAGTKTDVRFEDVAVNDTSGSSQTSWPGDGKIIMLRPSAAGDANAWTRGGTDSGANWSQTNNTPPNDVTSYNSSTTLNQEDLFNVTDSGIAASDTVNVVEVGWRYASTNAANNPTIKLEIEKIASGTILQSTGIAANSTTYKTNQNASPWTSPLVTYTDPDGGAWTRSTLDSMQIGYKLTTDNTNTIRVSEVWAYVDYTPNTGNLLMMFR